MARTRVTFACTACAHPSSRWAGRCPACGEWGTVEERAPSVPSRVGRPAVMTLIRDSADERIVTGFGGVDRVLGGGIVRGSVVLVAGEPGIGKSTLLLHLAANVGTPEAPALYASGEESAGQVVSRASRLHVPPERLSFVPGRELADVLDAAAADGPRLLIVDSIQAIRDPSQPALPGGTSQVRACTDALVGLAKREGIAVVLAGQVTKDGDLAGPRTLEHAVDVVCSFDGDPRSGLRVLSGGKNRFGEEGELAWFEMTSGGLTEVDPPALAVEAGEVGSATAVVRAGRGALAVEVQALTAVAQGPPRRNVSGLDPRRFGMLAAVLDRALGLRLGQKELFGAAAGGFRVDDPAADLAVAAALASASTGRPPPPGSAFVGELTLTGLVRPAPNLSARVRAARGAGLRTVFCAVNGDADRSPGMVSVRRLEDALAWAAGPMSGSAGTSGSRSQPSPAASR